MIRTALLNTSALRPAVLVGLALSATSPAFAQEDVPLPSSNVAAADPAEEELVITGSRISRPELSFPNPIQSFNAEAIEQSGETNVTDFLIDMPALVGSISSSLTSGSNSIGLAPAAGLNFLNLRNLGYQRTLVLVDGRRHVAAYPGTSAVDVNTIPADLIERVDVLTGGSSAIYGADGVSGVVNFILRRDFEGIRIRGQAGVSSRGDAGNRLGSIVAGKNFSDGRGNITLAYEFDQSDRLKSSRRSYTGNPLKRFELLRQAPPTDRPDDPNVPDRVLFNDLRWSDSSPDGAVDLGSFDEAGSFIAGALDGLPDFTGNGLVYDRGIVLPSSGGRTMGGSGTPTAGYFGDLLPSLTRHNINALFRYDFSDAVQLFAEGKYVKTKAFSDYQPTFDFFTFLAPDNAYLAERFGGLGAGGALVSRDNLDFGFRGSLSKRETVRGVIGLKGELNDHLRYEVSYTYGRNTAKTLETNDRLADRYFAALDAVVGPDGNVTCRINLPGEDTIDPNNYGGPPITFSPGQCIPLNVLGSANQAGLDFVLVDHVEHDRISQQVLSGYISGDLGSFAELPGGSIGFAVGGEYRREKSTADPSDVVKEGLLLDSSEVELQNGKFNVKEIYGELNLPILKSVPMAYTLSLGGAVRYSDYSTIGSTFTYKIDGVYAPVSDVTFRGTYSKAVRAPNIAELFAPLSGGFDFITDPCDISNRTSGSSFRETNCQALLANLGLTPDQIANFSPSSDPEASTSQLGRSGGNPQLKEESARTWTAGVVLRPTFVPGLAVTADWYDIKLRHTINTFTATQAFQLCVDQPTLDNVFCPLTERDPTTGFPNGFTLTPQNVALFYTKGLDFTLSYRVAPSEALGTFNFRLVGGYLKTLTFVTSPGADADEDAREAYAPKYLATFDLTWTKGPLSLNYGLAWQDKTRRFSTEELAANPDLSDPKFFFYKDRWEHDIQVQYQISDNFTFYSGINNFTDQKPARIATAPTGDILIGQGSYPLSPVGRFYYAGVKAHLDSLFGR